MVVNWEAHDDHHRIFGNPHSTSASDTGESSHRADLRARHLARYREAQCLRRCVVYRTPHQVALMTGDREAIHATRNEEYVRDTLDDLDWEYQTQGFLLRPVFVRHTTETQHAAAAAAAARSQGRGVHRLSIASSENGGTEQAWALSNNGSESPEAVDVDIETNVEASTNGEDNMDSDNESNEELLHADEEEQETVATEGVTIWMEGRPDVAVDGNGNGSHDNEDDNDPDAEGEWRSEIWHGEGTDMEANWRIWFAREQRHAVQNQASRIV